MIPRSIRLLSSFIFPISISAIGRAADKPASLPQTLDQVSAAYAKLEPQSIRPAEGFIKYDYLIPAGYYKQMWDWDGFFIGSHLAQQGQAAVPEVVGAGLRRRHRQGRLRRRLHHDQRAAAADG